MTQAEGSSQKRRWGEISPHGVCSAASEDVLVITTGEEGMLLVPNEWSPGCYKHSARPVQPPYPHAHTITFPAQNTKVAKLQDRGSGRDGGKLHPGARLSPAEAAMLGVHSETALGPHPAPGNAPSELATWPRPPN